MKNWLTFLGTIVLAMLLAFPSFLYAQQDKGAPAKKEIEIKGQIPADSSQYIIGPEDVLYIHVWKEEILSKTVTVRMDGKISMPLIDEVQAAGSTPLQLKEILSQKLKEFVDIPTVNVIVMEANSFKVFISGEIRKPGVYSLRSETSLAQIIPMAGGFTEWANPKKIIILRKEGGKDKRMVVDYKKFVQGGDPSLNPVLKPGDTIIVP
jgi:polysaccharide biosynthesis/export protein